MVRACCLLPACPALQPKVYSREGKELGEMPKGDMYIRDLKNTKGARRPAGVGAGAVSGHCGDRGAPSHSTPHSKCRLNLVVGTPLHALQATSPTAPAACGTPLSAARC